AAPGVEDDTATNIRHIIDLFICPSDRTWNTPVIGQGTTPPSEDEAISSWQTNGSSFTLNTRFMQGYIAGGNFQILGQPQNQSQRVYTAKIAKELLGGNCARFVMWLEQGAYASFYRATPDLASSQAAPQRRGWHHKYSYWAAGMGDGHVQYRYMDTRVTHSPDFEWTIWDPKKPLGGLP